MMALHPMWYPQLQAIKLRNKLTELQIAKAMKHGDDGGLPPEIQRRRMRDMKSNKPAITVSEPELPTGESDMSIEPDIITQEEETQE